MDNDPVSEVWDHPPAMVCDKLDLGIFFKNTGKNQARHCCCGFIRPTEDGEDLMIRDRLRGVIWLTGAPHRMDPDREVEV